ncbi:MAG: OmpA family protein [Bacteroidales bacterium]|nr:OmpA family protein [Bacteroidales bacterium]
MKLQKITVALVGLLVCIPEIFAQEESKYRDANWFFGLGGGLNVSFDGSVRGQKRYDSHMGAGWASDFYIGKWFSDFAGFRFGWQGLTDSDQFTDFGEKDFNLLHADFVMRPTKWFNPYIFGGYLKIDRAVPTVGVGFAVPIRINDKISIVSDFKYAGFSHKAFSKGRQNIGGNLSLTVGVSFRLGKPKPPVIRTETLIKEVEVTRVVRDTVVIREDKQSLDQMTKEVNELLRNMTLFHSDSFLLTLEARQQLSNIAEWLKRYPKIKVRIEGHTDNTGRNNYNHELSVKRAKAVLDFFLDAGISEHRLFYRGYGSTRPIADNSTPEGRHLNRRVELYFYE